jgi:hypothetical protein
MQSDGKNSHGLMAKWAKKKHQNQMKNKFSVYKEQKHPFLHLKASCFKIGKVTIRQIKKKLTLILDNG